MICGSATYQRVRDVAELALSRSVHAGRIDREAVVRNLKEVIVQRFLQEKRDLNQAQAEKSVHWAVKPAAKAACDLTHFVPCQLGHAKTPEEFSIGPVRFLQRAPALSRLELSIGAFANHRAPTWPKLLASFRRRLARCVSIAGDRFPDHPSRVETHFACPGERYSVSAVFAEV